MVNTDKATETQTVGENRCNDSLTCCKFKVYYQSRVVVYLFNGAPARNLVDKIVNEKRTLHAHLPLVLLNPDIPSLEIIVDQLCDTLMHLAGKWHAKYRKLNIKGTHLWMDSQ